jgi:hypothetical protein
MNQKIGHLEASSYHQEIKDKVLLYVVLFLADISEVILRDPR